MNTISQLKSNLENLFSQIREASTKDEKIALLNKAVDILKQHKFIGKDAPVIRGDIHYLVEHTKLNMHEEATKNLYSIIVDLTRFKQP